MGDVVLFRRPEPPKPRKGLCQHGFHRWQVVRETEFDSKQGQLVTRFRCPRCGKEKVEGR